MTITGLTTFSLPDPWTETVAVSEKLYWMKKKCNKFSKKKPNFKQNVRLITKEKEFQADIEHVSSAHEEF